MKELENIVNEIEKQLMTKDVVTIYSSLSINIDALEIEYGKALWWEVDDDKFLITVDSSKL